MEEWVVAIVNARPMGEEEPKDMVGIAECSALEPRSWLTICDDDKEANRIAEAVCKQLSLPMYDGADPFPMAGDASQYVDVEADGPDPYADLRNAAQEGGEWSKQAVSSWLDRQLDNVAKEAN